MSSKHLNFSHHSTNTHSKPVKTRNCVKIPENVSSSSSHFEFLFSFLTYIPFYTIYKPAAAAIGKIIHNNNFFSRAHLYVKENLSALWLCVVCGALYIYMYNRVYIYMGGELLLWFIEKNGLLENQNNTKCHWHLKLNWMKWSREREKRLEGVVMTLIKFLLSLSHTLSCLLSTEWV